MKWITRERPKIDRIACPWLIARFVDKAAEFLYVPDADVLRIAHRPIPYRQPSSKLYRYCTEPIHYTHFVILALIPQTKRASP